MSIIKRLILIFCVLILIAGCTQKENKEEPKTSPQVTSTTEPTIEPSNQPTVEPTEELEATPTSSIKSGYKSESLFKGSFEYFVRNPLPEHIVVENNEFEYGVAIDVNYKRDDGSLESIVTYYIQDNLNGFSSDGGPREWLESEAVVKKDGYYVFLNPGNPYIEGIDFSQYSDVVMFE